MTKVRQFHAACRMAARAARPSIVIVGDDGRWWVMDIDRGSKYLRAGYEAVDLRRAM